jgi:hypothetical protein
MISTFEFIRRPLPLILSPSSRTFVELTLITDTKGIPFLKCYNASCWIEVVSMRTKVFSCLQNRAIHPSTALTYFMLLNLTCRYIYRSLVSLIYHLKLYYILLGRFINIFTNWYRVKVVWSIPWFLEHNHFYILFI